MNLADPPGPASEPLWRLWFRYFWPFRYFRDVTRGSQL